MSEVRTLPTPISLTDFDVGVTLGTGSFGRVRFSTHKVLSIVEISSNENLQADNFAAMVHRLQSHFGQ